MEEKPVREASVKTGLHYARHEARQELMGVWIPTQHWRLWRKMVARFSECNAIAFETARHIDRDLQTILDRSISEAISDGRPYVVQHFPWIAFEPTRDLSAPTWKIQAMSLVVLANPEDAQIGEMAWDRDGGLHGVMEGDGKLEVLWPTLRFNSDLSDGFEAIRLQATPLYIPTEDETSETVWVWKRTG